LQQSRHLMALFGLLKMANLDAWDEDEQGLSNTLNSIGDLGYQLSDKVFMSVSELYEAVSDLEEGVILFDR
jgi:hypothetical protein